MTDEREVPELRPIREPEEREKELPKPGETTPLLRTPSLSTLRELIQLSRQSRMSAQDFLFFLLALKQLEGFNNPNPEVAELRAKLEAMEKEREEERLRRVVEETVRKVVGPLQARLEVVERAVMSNQAPSEKSTGELGIEEAIGEIFKRFAVEAVKEKLEKAGALPTTPEGKYDIKAIAKDIINMISKAIDKIPGPSASPPAPKQVEPIPVPEPRPKAEAGGEGAKRGGGGGKGEAGKGSGKRG